MLLNLAGLDVKNAVALLTFTTTFVANSKQPKRGTEGLVNLMSEWIRVKDEMPEPFLNVLVWIENGKAANMGYVTRAGHWFVHFWYTAPVKVTHWMPLPEPPKED